MAGKRLLDAAKLLDAVRSVGKQHIVLRRQQWDVYSKTSGVAKAVKNQTDRVTVTAEAAYELAKRFGETGPSWQQQRPNSPSSQSEEYGARQETGAAPPNLHGEETAQREKLSNVQTGWAAGPAPQTHLHAQSQDDDGTLSSLRKRELQRQSEKQIPEASADVQSSHRAEQGQDTFSERPRTSSPELSSLPRTKIPKHAEDAQESDKHVSDSTLNQDVFYTAGKPIENEDLPEGMNIDGVFSSPRVSRMVGKDGQGSKNPYAGRQKLPPKPLPEMVAAEERRKRDQVEMARGTQTERSQSTSQAAPSGDTETQDLAESIALDSEVQIAANRISRQASTLISFS